MQEIFGNQEHDPIPVGLKFDDLVHGTRITGVDFETGNLPESQQEQTANALQNLRRAVEAAGGNLDNVAQVSFFFKDFQGATMREVVNPLWTEMFTDENSRPTYKFMPAAELPAGQQVHVEFWAVLGQKRNSIQIPNVAHTNPIPFGVKMGRYLFSSRCLPAEASTGKNPEGFEAQLNSSLTNATTLLTMAGMSWSDVSQGRAFLGDPSSFPDVEKAWKAKFGGGAAAPLHAVRYGNGPTAPFYVEFIAAGKS